MPATQAEIAGWDISFGRTAPACRRAAAPLATGATVYHAKCQACHGEKGAGKPNDQLVGGQGTLRDANAVRTVGSYWPYATTLFDYVRRAMPCDPPQSLTDEEVYSRRGLRPVLNGVIKQDGRHGRASRCRR